MEWSSQSTVSSLFQTKEVSVATVYKVVHVAYEIVEGWPAFVVRGDPFHSTHCITDPGAERYKFSFTLRDSREYYINVTCWASGLDYVTKLHGSFKICDIGMYGNVASYKSRIR